MHFLCRRDCFIEFPERREQRFGTDTGVDPQQLHPFRLKRYRHKSRPAQQVPKQFTVLRNKRTPDQQIVEIEIEDETRLRNEIRLREPDAQKCALKHPFR